MGKEISQATKFDNILKSINMEIRRYDPSKVRSITLSSGGTLSLEKFIKKFYELNGMAKLSSTMDLELIEAVAKDPIKLIETLAKEKSIDVQENKKNSQPAIPDRYKDLTMNIDETHPGKEIKILMTDSRDIVRDVSGHLYIKLMGMKEEEAIHHARKVVPDYRPRDPNGLFEEDNDGMTIHVLNTYRPPAWMEYDGPLPDKLPEEFEKVVKHVFPSKIEREFQFNWLYASLFSRSFTYLILCGAPGIGKNRIKLVWRALHGIHNSIDGKKSTITERFNSQLAGCTMAWFDELHYNQEMENVMKEVQNDSISIERKGIDATRSTKIYASSVISNNKPRDNYIAFDARKFVPLQLTNKRLDVSMTSKEIDRLTKYVEDPQKEEYNIKFIAQIGRWIKKHGWTGKWPTLEYKGPMFYKLAHTSMSRWQKRAATVIIESEPRAGSRVKHEKNKGFLWSTIEEANFKKGDKVSNFPDYTSIKYFFDIFVDGTGTKSFETTPVQGSLMGDFWVKCLKSKTKIYSEAEVVGQLGDEEDEDYDL